MNRQTFTTALAVAAALALATPVRRAQAQMTCDLHELPAGATLHRDEATPAD